MSKNWSAAIRNGGEPTEAPVKVKKTRKGTKGGR